MHSRNNIAKHRYDSRFFPISGASLHEIGGFTLWELVNLVLSQMVWSNFRENKLYLRSTVVVTCELHQCDPGSFPCVDQHFFSFIFPHFNAAANNTYSTHTHRQGDTLNEVLHCLGHAAFDLQNCTVIFRNSDITDNVVHCGFGSLHFKQQRKRDTLVRVLLCSRHPIFDLKKCNGITQ